MVSYCVHLMSLRIPERSSRWSPAGLLRQTKAPNLFSDTTIASISKKVKVSWGQRSVDVIKLAYIFNFIDLHAQCHRFLPKRNDFRGQSSCWRKIWTYWICWSIAKCSQSSCRNYTIRFRGWPLATCSFSTRRSFDHHGKGNSKKEFRKNEKKVKLVRISHWSVSDENAIHCETACDCVNRANMVLGLRNLARSTQPTTSWHLLSAL